MAFSLRSKLGCACATVLAVATLLTISQLHQMHGGKVSKVKVNKDVAVCLVVKNQHDDILEFLDYHMWIGVGHFYIYDNNSTDEMAPIIQQYYDQGFIDYMKFEVNAALPKGQYRYSPQNLAYQDCIKHAKHKHKWLAFIDADEFLLIKDPNPHKQKIYEFMKDYEAFGGLGLNWLFFGSNGHKVRPRNSTLTSYTKCMPSKSGVNKHIKTIVNTKFVQDVGWTPHNFNYADRYFAVNENKKPIFGPFAEWSGKKIVLLHYAIKSRDEWHRKMRRGSGDGFGKPLTFFTGMDKAARATCLDAVEKGREFERCCFAGPAARLPKRKPHDGSSSLLSLWPW